MPFTPFHSRLKAAAIALFTGAVSVAGVSAAVAAEPTGTFVMLRTEEAPADPAHCADYLRTNKITAAMADSFFKGKAAEKQEFMQITKEKFKYSSDEGDTITTWNGNQFSAISQSSDGPSIVRYTVEETQGGLVALTTVVESGDSIVLYFCRVQ